MAKSPAHSGPEITSGQHDFAQSSAENWSPPSIVQSEREALRSLKAILSRHSGTLPTHDEFESTKPLKIIDLQNFEIYVAPHSSQEHREFEFISLHFLGYLRPKKLCFSGYLCVGTAKHYVQSVPIQDMSIEGYGNTQEPGVIAYLRSPLASQDIDYDIWFKLLSPIQAYERFHQAFLWVAQLTKHVIDYMDEQPARTVGLRNFRKAFHAWLSPRFANTAAFKRWHEAFRYQTDFCVGVHAYLDYTYHQAYNLSHSAKLLANPLWGECLVRGLRSISVQENLEKFTISTPEVYKSFRNMYFGNRLQPLEPSLQVQVAQESRKRELGFSQFYAAPASPKSAFNSSYQSDRRSAIRKGDVIAINPNAADQRLWSKSPGEWFAYVLEVTLLHDDTQQLHVLWMYRPCDTIISGANYPHENELFLSDQCNCSEAQLLSTEVKGRCHVQWSPETIDSTALFVRQTYIREHVAFITFQEKHKICSHQRKKSTLLNEYKPGDTVYIERTVRSQKTLDPVIITKMDELSNTIKIQKLARLGRDCSELAAKAGLTNIAPNELVLTHECEHLQASRIQRRCSIRFISEKDRLDGTIPSPYNYGGTGDLWFLSMVLESSHGEPCLEYLECLLTPFNEGPEFDDFQRKLAGLSLFSGGGSLDRGLEEGSAIEFRYAVDCSLQAIHTQQANARNISKLKMFCGSVDDNLKAVLQGSQLELIASVGDVEFIAAGSPCLGFSSLQPNALSEASLGNASHTTTFCSFVHVFLPQYGLLENVINMASSKDKGEFTEQNVLSQIVACLVGLGYQVSQYIMEAWNHGSGQHRSRIFLAIAAPGLNPITQPWHTHSTPSETSAGRSLGRLPDGDRFGQRKCYPTPFTHVSIGAITADLPNIGSGIIRSCVSYPDHRLSSHPSRKDRAILECIPKFPPAWGYVEALKHNLIPKSIQNPKKNTGKAYRRIREAGLVSTITTDASVQNSRNGACVHWSQNRPISILEARRAQNWPDHEVIIGSLAEQHKSVGNGVDRKVAVAIGLALRHAIEKGKMDKHASNNSLEKGKEQIQHQQEVEDGSPESSGVQSMIFAEMPSSTINAETSRFFSLPQNATRRSGSCSQSSTSTLPIRAKSETYGKRSLEEEGETEYQTLIFDNEKSGSTKPTKLSKKTHSSAEGTATTNSTKNPTHLPKGRDGQIAARRTRHSGLQVEFVPKSWNKRPECEHREIS